MTFSLRTFLVVIAILSVWLGALVSHSQLLVELAAGGTVLLILLSLPLAIWEPRPLQRAFWTGFCVLALGNLLYNGCFSSYQRTSNQIAQLIMGDQPGPYQTGTYVVPVPTSPGMFSPPPPNLPPVTSFYAPDDASADEAPRLAPPLGEEGDNGVPLRIATSPPPTTGPVPVVMPQPMPPTPATYVPAGAPYVVTTYSNFYYEQREAIRASVPSLISLLMGMIGGCVTMWIASRPKPESQI